MFTDSTTSEFAGNLLTGAIIVASAFLLYASLAMPQSAQAVQANSPSVPAIEQVVVTASHHHVS
jgi:hypothetical protein